ncbi:RhoGAP domain containing protein [Histomonas meleagridis]|uniref:RhoGAP domain containing protein n=1 Tax=Histomonas meleagridis TaxID=135588 RepID=UPI0035598AF2|nr:RhoGAP domain containing protein [Histomonas meleagridis]KAH0805966.1 RhoGAP domain containing protein [Histomonas meleagridis]
MYKMIEAMIKKGSLHTQGIFRLSGCLTNLDNFVIKADEGNYDFLEEIQIHDLSSLFKKWIRNISGSIIPITLTKKLMQGNKDQYMEIVYDLDKISRNVLMYLIGFLQKQQRHADVTKMDKANLAIVFGPNIIASLDEQTDIVKVSTITNAFVEYLISEWDTSSIYPLQKVFKE